MLVGCACAFFLNACAYRLQATEETMETFWRNEDGIIEAVVRGVVNLTMFIYVTVLDISDDMAPPNMGRSLL